MNNTRKHVDERTIELYVLKSDLLKGRRADVARHIAGCEGCASLHKEIDEYYAEARKLQDAQAEKAAHALYAPDRAIRPLGFSSPGFIVHRPASVPQRFVQSVRRYPVRWSVGLMAIIVASVFLPHLLRRDRNPFYARSKDEFLVVYNKTGDELWRKYVGWGYDVKAGQGSVASHPERALTTCDVDGDGTQEVLAVFGWTILRDPSAPPGNTILCLNADGTERWRYAVHRQVVIGGESYTDNYRIYQMLVGDFERNGNTQVILAASQDPWYPNVLIRLNAKDGSYVSEYWHPGVIPYVVQKDLNGDGIDEIIMAGQNNRFGQACLVVLDPRKITGYSPTPEKYVPPGMPKGQEMYYLLFPVTDMKKGWIDVSNQVTKLAIREGGLLEAAVIEPVYDYKAEVYYYFDSTMTCVCVRGSDHFTAVHKQYEEQGRFTRVLGDEYYEDLRKNVLYWDGSRFMKGRTEVKVSRLSAAK
ncbi:MAG: hypothetical protein NTZ35_08340 [Ignavibacteriales bacterium]|nr:hypothetical protein [Ignavibacteriales bacterium]